MSVRSVAVTVAAVTLALTAAAAAPASAPEPALTRLLSHGPWPPAPARDPSNGVSGKPAAIALGRRLFFDQRLSANGAIACATCHVPARGWSDARARAAGLAPGDRNTPTVLDVALHRWFSWDGRSDSLWSQSLKPIVDPREMGASGAHVATLLRGDRALACLHEQAFGAAPPPDPERALVHTGKALAAFLETVRSGRTPFDDFRDALARGDTEAAARYPASARRGAVLFVKSDCAVCHVGPAFTNGEFHDVGVPYALPGGGVDAGRARGIAQVRADRFNLLGPWSDDASRASAVKTRHVEAGHATFGQFRTPSLRNLALTAPYMHDGRYATLREAVRHYSELDMERIHTHGEQLLRPLKLAATEVEDLVAFLESLTDRGAVAVPAAPVAGRGCGA
ncbi:MAG TPA: cytochrome c peroxidase [Terriglobales bacterium]|nr:cytochrome c peroxidase [Terriglobales bacterium]